MANVTSIINIELSRKLTAIFLLMLILPSILCSFFILSFLLRKKQIRIRLNNHFFICIFFVYFIQGTCDLPLAIILFYQGSVAIPSDIFCTYWYILTSFLNMSSVQLNAYLSIERYLLIFHNPFLFKHKIILHYIPMITFIVMPFIYVVYVVKFLPCENHFDYHSWACGTACYLTHPVTGTFSWVFAIIAPLIVMIFFNIFLIGRVLYLKKRMMQRRIWIKNRKMLFQLLSLVGMLYISWMPSSITSVINTFHSTPLSYEFSTNWTLICFIYVAALFSPLTAVLAMPELKEEIFRCLNRWTQHRSSVRIIPAT